MILYKNVLLFSMLLPEILFAFVIERRMRGMGELAKTMVSEVKVENYTFCPAVCSPPGSTNSFFLGGAGVRGLQMQDKFVKFTAIGVYLEEQVAVPSLAAKWKGKNADELADSVEFFRDIVTGPFEKFMIVTMILPLTGQQYLEKVAENCVAAWKSMGIYTEAQRKALEEFILVFKDETFPPGSSILFTQSSQTITIGFSKDGFIPKEGKATIKNKPLSQAVIESMIGKNGVSPAAKTSLAVRLSGMMKKVGDAEEDCELLKVTKGEPAKTYPLPKLEVNYNVCVTKS